MAKYIGPRVVPIHEGDWSATKAYEALSLVYDAASGNSYISKKDVPAGTALTNEDYWAHSANFSAQLLMALIRLDNLIANAGNTEGNAELIDIRAGWDGKVYSTAGEAVRGQVTNIIYELNTNAEKSLKQGADIIVTESTYLDLNITSLNDFRVNSVYAISNSITSDMISGLPAYGTYGTLIVLNPLGDNAHSQYIYSAYDDSTVSSVYMANGVSHTDKVTPWVKIYGNISQSTGDSTTYVMSQKAVTDELNTNAEKSLKQGADIIVTESTYLDLNITSLNDFRVNSVYAISNSITSDMISGLPAYGTYGTLIVLNPLGDNAHSQYIYSAYDDSTVSSVYMANGVSHTDKVTPWVKIYGDKIYGIENGKSFSIIGDSYSAFPNWIPENNAYYYPTYSDTVKGVENMWWYKYWLSSGCKLLINDSYSGATICTHVRDGQEPSAAYVNRIKNSMGEHRSTSEKPDIIFILGGQNDQSVGVEIGTNKYSDWNDEDLYKFAPAFCYMLDYLKKWNPTATIINITNTGLSAEITNAMSSACSHYNVKNITLSNIEKDNGHPTITGMESICRQLVN